MSGIFAKTCIVKTLNGVEVARRRVVCGQYELDREYGAVRAVMSARYPDHYLFCDASEGVELRGNDALQAETAHRHPSSTPSYGLTKRRGAA